MKKRLMSLVGASLFLLGALAMPNARADEWDKKTVFTFNEPVQVPGAVLPAGTYVFKLAESAGDRNIVQIFNADETQVMATILAIPDYRDTPSDKTIITFDERPLGQSEAIQSWFYPGDNYGQEFVYPKQKATELAQVNSKPVPSIPDGVTEPAAIKTAAVTPTAAAPAPVTASAPAQPSTSEIVVSTTTVVAVEQLPQTASPLAAIALLGTGCFAGAALLRRRFAMASK